MTHNRGQQVVEVVGNPAREEANALQFLRLPQALFIAFPFRDVQQHTGVPNGATRFCLTRELGLASDLNPSHAAVRPNDSVFVQDHSSAVRIENPRKHRLYTTAIFRVDEIRHLTGTFLRCIRWHSDNRSKFR
jgi:hypothetical protein